MFTSEMVNLCDFLKFYSDTLLSSQGQIYSREINNSISGNGLNTEHTLLVIDFFISSKCHDSRQ